MSDDHRLIFDNAVFSWHADNRTEMANFKYGLGNSFYMVIALLATPVLVLPILLFIFDKLASKTYVTTNVISIDPKGFSINDLFLLNARQCADSCCLNPVKDQGALSVSSSSQIALPIIDEQDKLPSAAEALLKIEPDTVVKLDSLLNIVRIYEYHDLTNLAEMND